MSWESISQRSSLPPAGWVFTNKSDIPWDKYSSVDKVPVMTAAQINTRLADFATRAVIEVEALRKINEMVYDVIDAVTTEDGDLVQGKTVTSLAAQVVSLLEEELDDAIFPDKDQVLTEMRSHLASRKAIAEGTVAIDNAHQFAKEMRPFNIDRILTKMREESWASQALSILDLCRWTIDSREAALSNPDLSAELKRLHCEVTDRHSSMLRSSIFCPDRSDIHHGRGSMQGLKNEMGDLLSEMTRDLGMISDNGPTVGDAQKAGKLLDLLEDYRDVLRIKMAPAVSTDPGAAEDLEAVLDSFRQSCTKMSSAHLNFVLTYGGFHSALRASFSAPGNGSASALAEPFSPGLAAQYAPGGSVCTAATRFVGKEKERREAMSQLEEAVKSLGNTVTTILDQVSDVSETKTSVNGPEERL